jgi:hypothetical protein
MAWTAEGALKDSLVIGRLEMEGLSSGNRPEGSRNCIMIAAVLARRLSHPIHGLPGMIGKQLVRRRDTSRKFRIIG